MADVEYITVPSSGTLPGADNLPGWDNKAPDTDTVHAHDGGAWKEVTDEDEARIARAASKQASNIRTVVSSIGGMAFFYTGDYDPPMQGNGPGDTAYALDDNDNVIRLYRWTGTDWVRHEYTDAVLANLDVGKLTAGSASVSNVVAKHIWSGIVTSKAVEAEKITGDMIAAGSITATSGHIQSLDAGVITTGLLAGDRIAARSVTSTQIATGTLTSESGVFGNIDAGDIRTGYLDANRVNAATLKGKVIEGGTVTGGVVSGGQVLGASIATTSNGTGDRVEMTASGGLRVWRGSTVYAKLHPSLTNGLALYNANKSTVVETAEAKLTDVSSIIFGASFQSKTHSPKASPGSDGAIGWNWSVPAPASGRMVVLAQFGYETGSQSPPWRGMSIQKERDSGTWATTNFVYNINGWTSDTPLLMGIATGLSTTGTVTIWTKIAFRDASDNFFTRWEASYAAALFIPC